MFTPKSFKEILNDMVGWVTLTTDKITNFRVGSVVRTILEAVSIEIEQLYFQVRKMFRYAISESVYTSFDFNKLPAKKSTGYVRLVFAQPLTVQLVLPKGFLFSTQPSNSEAVLRFETPEEYLFPVGTASANIMVQCTTPGVVGNIESMAIRYTVSPIMELSQVYNDIPFYDGADEEAIEDRKKRFALFVTTLSRGTLEAVRYAVVKVPGVTGTYLYESPGVIFIYAHNSQGELPTELRASILESVDEYKAAGIQIILDQVVTKPVNLVVQVEVRYGTDLNYYSELIRDTLIAYLNTFPVSVGLSNSEVVTKIMGIDTQVIKSSSVTMNGSSSNLATSKNEIIRSGSVTVLLAERPQ